MKLTKHQQEIVNRMINESLEGVLEGRMIEASEGMEDRVDHDVVSDALANSENVKAIALEAAEPAIMKFEARMAKVIAAAIRQHGVAAISPNDVDDVLQRTHAGRYEELSDALKDQIGQMLAKHAADLASLVVSAFKDDM